MFINPQTAIDNGWITGLANPEKQVQPNAIDFTIDRLFDIDYRNTFVISETEKQMRGGDEIFTDSMGIWCLDNNMIYDMLSDVYVTLPEGVAAMLIIRSTFNRNGVFLTSGLYDAGFQGHIGCVIHNTSGEAVVTKGTRIGQIMFIKADNAGLYTGGYNHAEGTAPIK